MIQITETLLELPLVAHRFGVPEQTIDGWIEAGLEHETWNGRVLTSMDAIERFLQKMEHSAVVEAGQKMVA